LDFPPILGALTAADGAFDRFSYGALERLLNAQQVAAAISLLTWCAHLIIAVTKPSAAILLLIRGSPSSI